MAWFISDLNIKEILLVGSSDSRNHFIIYYILFYCSFISITTHLIIVLVLVHTMIFEHIPCQYSISCCCFFGHLSCWCNGFQLCMLYPSLYLSFLSVQIRPKSWTDMEGGAWGMENREEQLQDQFRSTFYYIGYNISRGWKKSCDDSSAGDTVLSAVPLSLMENIYKLFPFPKSQWCTAFHMKQTVTVKKLITAHIDDS